MKSIVLLLENKIKALWSRFNAASQREKRILLAAFVAVTVMVADQGIVRPLSGNIRGLNRRLVAEETNAVHNMRSLSHKPVVDAVFLLIEKNLDLSIQNDEEVRASILQDVEMFGRLRGVDLAEVKPQVSTERPNFREYRVRMQIEGTMEKMVAFLGDLVKTKRIYLIESFRIVPHGEDINKIKATVTINRLVAVKTETAAAPETT